MADMLSGTIHMPLFPLGIFLLPGERTSLHIFEERYKQLFSEAEQNGLQFGIPFSNGRIRHSLGSRCKLLSVVKRYEGGEIDVLIECTGIFKLKEFKSSKEDRPYPYGVVEMLSSIVNEAVSADVENEFHSYVEMLEENKGAFVYPSEMKMMPILTSLNLTDLEKFRFLQISDVDKRNQVLCNLVKFSSLVHQQEFVREDGLYLS